MKKAIYWATGMFIALPVWAKDIFQVADKVERNGSKFAIQIAAIGILVASFGYIFGQQDANEKLMKALIGTLLACTAGAIVATIKAWV